MHVFPQDREYLSGTPEKMIGMSVHNIITLNTKQKQNPNFILQLRIHTDHSESSQF